jgi:hypothetical protein
MKYLLGAIVVGCSITLATGCGSGVQAEQPAKNTPQAAKKSVTVFPVVIKPETPPVKREDGTVIDFSERVGAVVATLLERANIEDVELGKPKFKSPEGSDAAQIAAEFGKFICQHPIQTEYAMYGEVHGTPQTGPQEILTILVDKQGRVVLAASDTPKTYSQTSDLQPKDPMSCSIFMGRKVQKLWGLPDPLRERAPEGKMAAYWTRQSGVPAKAELAAMKDRLEKMKAGINTSRVTVYPVRLQPDTDRECADELAGLLSREKICQAVVADADPKLQTPGDPNEQKVLWDTAKAFREYIRQHPPATQYALYADYIIGSSHSGKMHVGGVHFIVCDRAGDWVIVDFQNSHHPNFQAIDPKSKQDCNRLLAKRLAAILSKAE